MRPAVYASVMRNRKAGPRRVYSTPHKFSWQRFFVMLFVGAVLFIPGLIVTIIGLEHTDNYDNIPGDSVLYKFIGPASLALGVCLVCASGIYYCCWGVQSPVSSKHSHKHKKSKEHSEQYDPLQSNIPAISSDVGATSPHSSIRTHSSTHGHEGHNRTTPEPPDQRSSRSGSNRHRSSSQSSTHSSRNHSSRHRNTSHTSHSHHSSASHSHSNHSHNSNNHRTASHTSSHASDNQVPFVHQPAPLAQGETGSVDISIDIDSIEVDKKF